MLRCYFLESGKTHFHLDKEGKKYHQKEWFFITEYNPSFPIKTSFLPSFLLISTLLMLIFFIYKSNISQI